ncbi:Hypothetical protein R9X50_00431600 [Acrodontium crateriforme]|uniref:Uncharacterized protein n=1 Tax=Acrodontium crateriforme TaxID=150365 RepID=A0AAQ3RAP1_9PEZI|nr:Hypothetical protein R9X50_00431600 [Acrodontium crateriforme]
MHINSLVFGALLVGAASSHQNVVRQAYGSGTVDSAAYGTQPSAPYTAGTSKLLSYSIIQPKPHGASTYSSKAPLPNHSVEPQYTTYTTLCETTVNGSAVVATHTHSKVLPPSGYAPPLTGSVTGIAPASTSSSTVNATCGGQTLNVLGASLDWWYTHTYTYTASTFDILYNSQGVSTGWTLLSATTIFDIASAVVEPTCTSTLSYYSQYNTSLYSISCFETPVPTAAATSVLTQTAYKSFNQTTGTGSLPDVATTPPPAAATIPSSGGIYSAGTPFVFFSAYEIMTKFPTTYRNGSRGCAEATQLYTMKSPFSFEYAGEDVDGQEVVNAGVTGDVNPAFLGVVNVTAAVAGSWVAAPTVVVVMEKILGAQVVLANTQTTVPALQTPTPTLPAGIVPITTTTAGLVIPTDLTARIESTAVSLILPTFSTSSPPRTTAEEDTTSAQAVVAPVTRTIKPFTAHVESSVVTLEIDVPASQTVVTAVFNGKTVTAGAVTQTGPQAASAAAATSNGGVAALIGAIIGASQSPTNALEVLSQAITNPTTAALAGAGQLSVGANQLPLLTLGSSTYTPNAATQFSIAPSEILTPGGKVVVDGSTISLASGATAVIINGVTSSLSPPSITAAPILVMHSTAYLGNQGSAFDVAGKMLTPGEVMTVSGTTYSLASDGSVIVVNGATHTIGPMTNDVAAKATITAPPVLTIGDTVYGANGGTSYVISSQTLTPGGTIVLSGANGDQTISLNLAANTAYTIVDSGNSTITSAIGVPTPLAPLLEIDGETFTAVNPAVPSYVIDGETLVPGGSPETVTISGSTFILSLEPQATVLVIEEPNGAGQVTSTIYETLFPATVKSTVYMTEVASATATTSSTSESGSTTPTAGLQNHASSVSNVQWQALTGVGLVSLVMAIWL